VEAQLARLVQQAARILELAAAGQLVTETVTTVVLVLFLLGGKFNGTFCKNK
jgi:membrane-bound ClpP family serine protease